MKNLIKLGFPVVLSYLGLMTMGLVDLIFVGRVGADETSAVGIGNSIFSGTFVFGLGILTSLEYYFSFAHGAKDTDALSKWFLHGIILSVVIGIILMILGIASIFFLPELGLSPNVVSMTKGYIIVNSISVPFALLFNVGRFYLQSQSKPKPAMLILFVANVLNFIFNYLLVPKYTVLGSALATFGARFFMVVSIIGYIYYSKHGESLKGQILKLKIEKDRINKIFKMGLPAGVQMALEVGVFAMSTLIIARWGSTQMASHQIVLNIASIAFMVPLALGSSAAVLVGQSLGSNDSKLAVHYGWQAIKLGFFVMICSALFLNFTSPYLLSVYTKDQLVLDYGSKLLLVAALFQIFDGSQTIAIGALRGLGDTRFPAFINLIGYWVIGLPVGLYFGFSKQLEALGFWYGLFAGLVVAAFGLVSRWAVHSKKFI